MQEFPSYIICLDREVQRKRDIQQTMDQLGQPFEFAPAVEGRHFPEKYRNMYDAERAMQLLGRELGPNELGCYASHMEIIKKVSGQTQPFALVLESDAAPDHTSFQIVTQIAKRPTDWDLILLHWTECLPSFWQRVRLSNRHQLVRFSRRTHSAAAYLISPQGARKLLSYSFPIIMPIDDLMVGGHVDKGMETWGVTPQAVTLSSHSENSSSQAERQSPSGRVKYFRDPWYKKFERGLRKIRYQLKAPPQI